MYSIGTAVQFKPESAQYAKNQGITYIVTEAPDGASHSTTADGRDYVWLVHSEDVDKAPSRRRTRSAYVTALEPVGQQPRTYVVGLPVVITINAESFVSVEVDLSEMSSAMRDDNAAPADATEEQIRADRETVSEWANRHDVSNEGFAR